MSFDLRINFSGQCMFAPERVSDEFRGRMHVLFPNSAAHHGADRHVPIIAFDTVHLRENSASRTGRDETTAVLPLRGCALKWDGADADLSFPADTPIPNLKEVTGKSVESTLLTTKESGALAARITFGTGKMEPSDEGADWEWITGEPRRFTHRVDWIIPNAGESFLDLRLVDFKGVPVPAIKPLKLFPLFNGTRDVIDLSMHHIPSGDLPPDGEVHHTPELGSEAPHFSNYYSLFSRPVKMRVPRFAGPGSSGGGKGGSPFNCMIAGTWP
jgi:hypothetical protein